MTEIRAQYIVTDNGYQCYWELERGARIQTGRIVVYDSASAAMYLARSFDAAKARVEAWERRSIAA